MAGLKLEFPEWMDLSGDRFFDFCAVNRDLRIERTADGEIIIMPPTDHETGRRNSELNFQLLAWAKRDGKGIVSDSSTGFELPNGAIDRLMHPGFLDPDTSWPAQTKRLHQAVSRLRH